MLPASDHHLQVVKKAQNSDETWTQKKSYYLNGWPGCKRIQGTVKKYLPVKDDLLVTSALLLRGNRLVIPQSLRPDVLNKLHVGHQRIS